jgi:Spy/CpxP family protein refolding chaperone
MKRIILPAALLLAATLSASAQDATANPQASRMIRRVEHRLNVTDAQREQVKAILAAERPTLAQLHTQLASEHAEMAQQTTFDEARTRAIAAKYADTNTAVLVEREKLHAELFAIFTPEQQKKVEQLRARFGAAIDSRLETLGDNL